MDADAHIDIGIGIHIVMDADAHIEFVLCLIIFKSCEIPVLTASPSMTMKLPSVPWRPRMRWTKFSQR
jgi:hypothetical protein